MLAAPAQTAAGAQLHFHHRRRIGEDAVAEASDLRRDSVGEPLQAHTHQLMVVASEGVAGNVGAGGIGQVVFGAAGGGPVVEARRNDADGSGHQRLRARPEGAVVCHIIHFAMAAGGQPVGQALFGSPQAGAANANCIEAEIRPPLLDVCREDGPVE